EFLFSLFRRALDSYRAFLKTKHRSKHSGTPLHSFIMPGDSDSSPASTPPSSVTVSRNLPDTAALLLVLICYVHILRLHVALFAHIQQYLQFISETGDRTINALPGLCGFDNFPLR
ncbi:hypothetical protein QBC46DRAFT_59191, partial [Diplogelasinospora grovesii]